MFKTLLISSEYPPGPGGIGTHAYQVANTLFNNKKWVVVCTISDYANAKEVKNFDENSLFQVVRFKRYRNHIINWYYRINTVCRTIINQKITHVFVSGRASVWLIPVIKLISNVKIIAIIHGSEFKIGLSGKFSLACLQFASNLIAVSKFTKSLIPQRMQLRTVVSHNGIDLSEWRSQIIRPNLENYPILLTVGSLSLRKGQHNIINALPFIKKQYPNVHYHCVGQTKEKERLLKLIHKLGLGNSVSIHGIVSKSTLEDLYNESHVNMILSEKTHDGDREGYGISVLEGNIFGVPAIGSNHSGLKESITHNLNGVLVDQTNPKEIVKALNNILFNYDNFYNNSIKNAKNNSWHKKIRHYENFIK